MSYAYSSTAHATASGHANPPCAHALLMQNSSRRPFFLHTAGLSHGTSLILCINGFACSLMFLSHPVSSAFKCITTQAAWWVSASTANTCTCHVDLMDCILILLRKLFLSDAVLINQKSHCFLLKHTQCLTLGWSALSHFQMLLHSFQWLSARRFHGKTDIGTCVWHCLSNGNGMVWMGNPTSKSKFMDIQLLWPWAFSPFCWSFWPWSLMSLMNLGCSSFNAPVIFTKRWCHAQPMCSGHPMAAGP